MDAPKLKALVVNENYENDWEVNQQTIDFIWDSNQSKIIAPLNDILVLIFLLQNMLGPGNNVIVWLVNKLLRIGHSANVLVNVGPNQNKPQKKEEWDCIHRYFNSFVRPQVKTY